MTRKESVAVASEANPPITKLDVALDLIVTDQLYTASEVAGLFRCSTKTLERWRMDGRGPKVTRLWDGGRPLYRGKHILEALESAVEDRTAGSGDARH